jgi:hypothetical protein
MSYNQSIGSEKRLQSGNFYTFLQRLTPRKKTIMGNKGVICNGDKTENRARSAEDNLQFCLCTPNKFDFIQYLFTYICVHTCWSSSSYFIYISCKNSIF